MKNPEKILGILEKSNPIDMYRLIMYGGIYIPTIDNMTEIVKSQAALINMKKSENKKFFF